MEDKHKAELKGPGLKQFLKDHLTVDQYENIHELLAVGEKKAQRLINGTDQDWMAFQVLELAKVTGASMEYVAALVLENGIKN